MNIKYVTGNQLKDSTNIYVYMYIYIYNEIKKLQVLLSKYNALDFNKSGYVT